MALRCSMRGPFFHQEEGYGALRTLLSRAGGVLLAATTVVGLTIGMILAQGNPSGSAESGQDEPIKRTVLFRGDLEGAPGKEIVVFVADLAPGAIGAKHYHPGPEFFYVLEGTLAHEPEGGSAHT